MEGCVNGVSIHRIGIALCGGTVGCWFCDGQRGCGWWGG